MAGYFLLSWARQHSHLFVSTLWWTQIDDGCLMVRGTRGQTEEEEDEVGEVGELGRGMWLEQQNHSQHDSQHITRLPAPLQEKTQIK